MSILKAKKDHKLGEYFIKKGTCAAPILLMLHFNPEYFPNPFKFDPDRWLDDSKNLSMNEPFSFIPFR